MTQLSSYLDKYIHTTVSVGVVSSIYFDFAKGFDSVPHERLLGNLKSYSINGTALEWIKAFLRNRRQIVNVNGMKSDPASNCLEWDPPGWCLGTYTFRQIYK